MYEFSKLVNTIFRGENMKRAIGMMALGMGFGASAMFLYDQYKSGELEKTVDRGAKEISKAVTKASKKITE